MIIRPVALQDAFIIETSSNQFVIDNVFFDKRGIHFVQDNLVYSKSKNTVRGMHYQSPPFTQGKLIWCSKGKIRDIIVDFRIGSPTYLNVFSVELSSENKKILYVPRGFLHGYETLTDDTIIEFKVDNYYCSSSEVTVDIFDKDIGVELYSTKPILNSRDQNGKKIKDIISPFIF